MPSVTTSIRLDAALKKRLDRTAKQMKKTRNEVVVQAIDKFTRAHDKESLRRELQRAARAIAEHDAKSADSQEVMRQIEAFTAELLEKEADYDWGGDEPK